VVYTGLRSDSIKNHASRNEARRIAAMRYSTVCVVSLVAGRSGEKRDNDKESKRIPSNFNDESTGLFICLRRHIYMSHVNKVQLIRVKMLCVAVIRVTCICVA
jgi:hypothetical protein